MTTRRQPTIGLDVKRAMSQHRICNHNGDSRNPTPNSSMISRARARKGWTVCRNAAKCGLFDHVIGARTQGLRHLEAQRLCRLQIDHQLELRRILHWKIGWHGALKNAIDITCRLADQFGEINAIGDQGT
jgi:hypothetical protein